MDSLKKANQQKEIPHRSEGFQAAFLSIQPGAGYGSRTRLTCLGSTGTTDVLTLPINSLLESLPVRLIIIGTQEKIKTFLRFSFFSRVVILNAKEHEPTRQGAERFYRI